MKYQSFGMAFIGPGVSSDRFPVNDSSCETMVGKPRFSSKRLRIHPGRIYANRDQIWIACLYSSGCGPRNSGQWKFSIPDPKKCNVIPVYHWQGICPKMAKLIFEIRSNSSRWQPYLRLPKQTFWDGVLESKNALKRARIAATFLEMLSFLFPCSPPTNLGTGVLLQDWWRSSALDWAAGFYWSTVFGRTLLVNKLIQNNLPRILNPGFSNRMRLLMHWFVLTQVMESAQVSDHQTAPTIRRTQRHGSNPRASSGTCRRSESCRIESSKWANGSVTWQGGWNDNFFGLKKHN